MTTPADPHEQAKARYNDPDIKALVGKAYATWFYASDVWTTMGWCGIETFKSPCDMWNYQEIIYERSPSLIVEFGTHLGGSTLFFANLLQQLGNKSHVLSVDVVDPGIPSQVRNHPLIELMTSSSVSKQVSERILALRGEYTGSMFVILDSDHHASHVYEELKMLRNITSPGDYVIVEDSSLNGRPIPAFIYQSEGGGPWEGRDRYEKEFPNDYMHDVVREQKFAWTLSTDGFLIRK